MNRFDQRQKYCIDTFAKLDDEYDQFDYLISISLTSEIKLDKTLRNEKNLIKNCKSNLWIIIKKEMDGTINIRVDSDSLILKGLLLVIKNIYQGLNKEEIKKSSFKLMEYVKVGDLLSNKRKDSIEEIISKINEISKS